MHIRVVPTDLLLWVLGLVSALSVLMMPFLLWAAVYPEALTGEESFSTYVFAVMTLLGKWFVGGELATMPGSGLAGFLLPLLGPVVFGSLCAFIASRRGLNVFLTAVLGAIFPMVGLVVAIMMPNKDKAAWGKRVWNGELVGAIVVAAVVLAVTPFLVLYV